MNNVRTIYLDWYNGSVRATGGSQLAYQYDHLSNLVIFENAPKLDNYYLIVEMKETEDGEVRAFEPIQLAGSFWLIPNSYTQLAQNVSFQVCCKTENGDFERHSAQFTGTILPSKDHAGEELDIDPSIMYDPYKQWVQDIAMGAGAIVVDPTLSVQGAAADAKAVGDYIMSDAEAVNLLAEASDDEERDFIGEGILSWLDDHPEAVAVQDGSITDAKLDTNLKRSMFSESAYYDEIVFTKERHYDTDCYFASIPVLDSEENVINFYVGHETGKNPLEYAIDNHTTLSINGSCSLDIGEPTYVNPIRIGEGTVYNGRRLPGYSNPNPRYICMKPDRSHGEFLVNSDITTAQLLSLGYTNVFSSYAKIVENSAIMDLSGVYWNEFVYSDTARNPLMLLGFDAQNNIVLMATDGRTDIDAGLTLDEGATLMLGKSCKDVYVLDGGGSTCLCDRGSKINRNIDDHGTTVRGGSGYSINVKKPFSNTSEEAPTSRIGIEKQRMIEQIIPYINFLNARMNGCVFELNTANIDLFPQKGLLGAFVLNCGDANVLGTKPEATGLGIIFTLKQSGSYARQMYIPFTQTYETKYRIFTYASGEWGDWQQTIVARQLTKFGRTTFSDFIVQANGSKTFSVANTTRATLTLIGPLVEQHGMVIVASSSSGIVRHTDISLGTSLTISVDTNQLTVNNSGNSQVMVNVQTTYGSITEVSNE